MEALDSRYAILEVIVMHAAFICMCLQESEIVAIAEGAHFDTVLASGAVEYIDVNEENDTMVCHDYSSTHA